MQIGRFWGFTAPMLILASPDKEKLGECLSLLNTSMNRNILQDLRSELYALERINQLSVTICELSEDSILVTENGNWEFHDGNFVVNGEIFELQQLQAFNDLAIVFAGMIIKGERRGRFVKLKGTGDLQERLYYTLKSSLQKMSFSSDKMRASLRNIYNELELGDVPIGRKLAVALALKSVVPDTVIINGKEHTVTADAKKVCEYYIGLVADIESIKKMANVATVHEEKVFSTSFFNLANRKPESLLYMVLNQFEHVKTARQNATVIKNVIAEVTQNIETFKDCFTKYVSTYNSGSLENVLTQDLFSEIIAEYPEKKKAFFKTLYRIGFCCQDWLLSDFRMLGWLYDLADSLSPEKICSKFGIEVNNFNDLIPELCELGICGLNVFQKELFFDAISNISLTTGDSLLKTQEEIDETWKVIDLIESLLDSLLPIGAEI